ncbi:MAG: histidine kinase [Pseudomonadota bacterium]
MGSSDLEFGELTAEHDHGRNLRGFAITTAFCLAVALLLWLLGIAPLVSASVISFSIGWSIQTLFALLRTRLEPRVGILITSVLLTLSGLLTGLLLSSAVLFGNPLFLLLDAPGTVLLGVIGGVCGYQIVNSRERLLNSRLEVAQLEQTRAEQAQQLAETELKVLQAQIEPHFLFNTLGNIQSLIHDEPDKADAMLTRLTTLLRGSLGNARSRSTTLAQELELTRAFLEIQQIRMGDRLQFSIATGPGCGQIQIPPLLIQPLVENAITHGIEVEAGPGTIEIDVRTEDGMLEVSVSDSGPGPEADPQRPSPMRSSKGTGTALANIRARLHTAYGHHGSLQLFALKPKGTRAQLRLPLDRTTTPAVTPEP